MREGPRRCRLLAVAALAGRLCFAQEGETAAGGPVPPISEATGIAPPVVVEADRLPEPDGVRPEAVLGVEELRRQPASTLGAAVADTLGVNNASFGPGVGLPVIRGLSGSRVKVTVGGIGTHDASSVSPDHAVTAEPILAEQIRIVRGPSTIRYGSGALGGVVEVEDGRIPARRPERPLTGAVEVRYGTNAQGRTVAAKLDAGANFLALHADAFYRAQNDISIPGYAIDEQAIFQQFGLTAEDNTFGYVANTDLRAGGGSVGASLLGDDSMVGVSASCLQNNYGIPGGAHAHVHPGEPAGPDFARIDLERSRYDLRARTATRWPWLEAVELEAGFVDYRHDELDAGVAVTTFRNRVAEARLELAHTLGEAAAGRIGLHALERDFSALGEEAFVPESRIDSRAVYLIEGLRLGKLRLEGAMRQEEQRIVTQPQPTIFGTLQSFPPTTFTPFSWSGSIGWEFDRRSSVTFTYAQAQRAPDVQELYSLGPHLATRTFDIGDPALGLESMTGVDFGVRAGFGPLDLQLDVFDYAAADYIYQENTGAFYDTESQLFLFACVRLEDCLPVVQYTQQDATLRGYEAQLAWGFDSTPLGPAQLALFTDYVRGRLADGTDIPRMPPRRAGLEATAYLGRWTARVRYTHGFAQDHPGQFETPTAAYDLLNAYLDLRLERGAGREIVLFLNATNLLDEEIRNSTSYLRSFSPEPGRGFEFGVRARF
jgi:iron complex outermembrane receptor protein